VRNLSIARANQFVEQLENFNLTPEGECHESWRIRIASVSFGALSETIRAPEGAGCLFGGI